MARMTQTEIISSLADSSGLKKTEVKAVFDALATLATDEVKKNGEFTLPGFGKLKKTNRKAREGRNPATGAVIKIPAKTTVNPTARPLKVISPPKTGQGVGCR